MKVNRSVGKVLGELEHQVMDLMWLQTAPVTVREMLVIIQKNRKIAYTTLMTIMSRLVDKELLIKSVKEGTNYYIPAFNKKHFISQAIHSVFSNTVHSLGDEAIAYFAKELEKIDPQKRKKLLELLDEE